MFNKNFILVASSVMSFLVFSEYLWRAKYVRGEYARKMVHSTLGVWVAFWPYFLSFRQIQVICVAAFIIALISKKVVIFHAMHDVKRRGLGELLYSVGIGLTAYYFQTPIIFTVAILQLAISDSIAAIIGKKFGKRSSYSIFGTKKSIVGFVAFALSATAILSYYVWSGVVLGGNDNRVFIVPLIGLILALCEVLSPYGTDNLTIPLVCAFLLSI
jgi:phytol kinase